MPVGYPWWEPEYLNQHPSFGPSQDATPPLPGSCDGANPDLYAEYSPCLLPLTLLAPFTENITATGYFPTGYYCTTCGRINVQRFLRHRICENVACDSRADRQWENGWAINAFSTRDHKVISATIIPDDKWVLPTTAEPGIAFEDGSKLFHYRLAVSDTSTSPATDADTLVYSVRHVFYGGRELLHGDASTLFKTLQRDVLIERSIGTSVFLTPQIGSRDDPALGRNGPSVWDQQAALIESALSTCCGDMGPLKVSAVRVHAWTSYGKVRISPCPSPPSRPNCR